MYIKKFVYDISSDNFSKRRLWRPIKIRHAQNGLSFQNNTLRKRPYVQESTRRLIRVIRLLIFRDTWPMLESCYIPLFRKYLEKEAIIALFVFVQISFNWILVNYYMIVRVPCLVRCCLKNRNYHIQSKTCTSDWQQMSLCKASTFVIVNCNWKLIYRQIKHKSGCIFF